MNEQISLRTREAREGREEDAQSSGAPPPVETNGDSQGETLAEEWRPVVGYEGSYEVSNLGRVRGRTRRVMALQTLPSGYRTILFSRENKKKVQLVHRLVCRAFNGPPTQERPIVNHRDGVKANNTASNLEWCSQSENAIHALNTGLRKPETEERPRGEKNHKAVLTESIVIAMRDRHANGSRISEIAKSFKRSWCTTRNAVRGLTWSHLQ